MNAMLLLSALILVAPLRAQTAPVAASTAAVAASSAAVSPFQALCDEYWDARMKLEPLWATFIGHPGYDGLLDDNSRTGREEERRVFEDFLARADKGLATLKLSPEEKVSLELIRFELSRQLERQVWRMDQFAVDHMDGIQSWLPTVVETAQPMKDEKDAQALVARMKAVPLYVERHIANLKEGLSIQRVAARTPVEKTIRQLDELAALKPSDTAFAAAGRRLPEDLRGKYLPQIEDAAKEVAAAWTSYADFLRKDYLPASRAEIPGLAGMPRGRDLYAFLAKWHTTSEMSPDYLHQIGKEEVAGIEKEMAELAKKKGHEGELKAFLDQVRADPANFFKTREEVVEAARTQVERTKQRLPEFFGTLPKTPLVVKPVEAFQEKNEAAARYFQPPQDLSRPGIYYINTYEPTSRPRFSMASLAAHEGLPGHHLQIALGLELPGLPTFRRNTHFTAFVEGWALYSERLADEMGLYTDDLSRLGMLSDQALRACRLVVDTGLHTKGWTRDEAVDYMKAHTPMSQGEIEAEVDRYINWPGQALAYKVGQREIMALRREVETQKGAAFKISAFHDAVLAQGALPLPLLRKQVLGAMK